MSLFRTLVESVFRYFLTEEDKEFVSLFNKKLLDFAIEVEDKLKVDPNYKTLGQFKLRHGGISVYWASKYTHQYTFKNTGPLGGKMISIVIPAKFRCANHPVGDHNCSDCHILIPNKKFNKDFWPFTRPFKRPGEKIRRADDPKLEYNFTNEKYYKFRDTYQDQAVEDYNDLINIALYGENEQVNKFGKEVFRPGYINLLENYINTTEFIEDKFGMNGKLPLNKEAFEKKYAWLYKKLNYFVQSGKEPVPTYWFENFINNLTLEDVK